MQYFLFMCYLYKICVNLIGSRHRRCLGVAARLAPAARGTRRAWRWRWGRQVRSRAHGAWRHAAPPPAQPSAYKGPNHRASIRTPSPEAWRVAGGRRRGGGRRKPGGVRGSCRAGRSYRRHVAPCRIRCSAVPEAADRGFGGSQMWTELWVTCAQIHQMLYFFFRRPQNLVAIRFEMGKKEPGVMPGRLGLRTLGQPPS